MVGGKYDKYMRKLVIGKDAPFLKDGGLYLPVPSDNYYHIQANIIFLLSEELFSSDLEKATTHFIQNHSEQFAKEWNSNPSIQASMLEHYCRKYIPEINLEKVKGKLGNF